MSQDHPFLDLPLTFDNIYRMFVTESAELEKVVADWYRESKGHEPAVSDVQHGMLRCFEAQQFTSRWGTMGNGLQNTWPIVGPTPPPGSIEALHVEGTRFVTASGQLFQWRGYSWFLGYRRFLAGENVTDDLRQLRAFGFNLVRVFGPLPWVETPDYRYETFNVNRLSEFFALLASEGFYCEFVIGCYDFGPQDEQGVDRHNERVAAQGQFSRLIFNIASAHPNVVIEAVNEPSVGAKPDPVAMLAGVDRHGVLSAYGIYQPYYTQAQDDLPTLDYCTIHTTRDSAWHRKARHAQELQHRLGKPVVSDEPAKITEPGFAYPGGKNDPLATPREAAWHFGVCCLWTAGSTVHTEEGKWGRVPTPGMLQYTILNTVKADVWDRIDPSWQTGEYNHSENNDSPVDDVDEPDGDPIWTYTSLHAAAKRALSIRCGVSKPLAINGWTADAYWGEGSSFVRLSHP